jgi:catechol 2,3-dioxygenase
MTTAIAEKPSVAIPRVPDATRLGPVHLAVTDAKRALPVWRDLVGLTELGRSGNAISLGAGGRELILLETGAARPVVPNTSGLYHVAIHVPTRKELARVTARFMAARFRNSPTDHLVSEAVYAWDLDGNGIEMTFETPARGKLKSDGDNYYGLTPDGRRHSGRDPIDLDSLFAELAESDDLRAPLPAGTRIGHVHLHVADLDKTMGFYSGTIGFAPLMMNKRIRMADVKTDYPPHILAFNTWAGEGAPQPPDGSAGLRWFTIVASDVATLAAIRDRVAASGAPVSDIAGGFETRDPSGNRVKVLGAS